MGTNDVTESAEPEKNLETYTFVFQRVVLKTDLNSYLFKNKNYIRATKDVKFSV